MYSFFVCQSYLNKMGLKKERKKSFFSILFCEKKISEVKFEHLVK